MGMMWEPYLGMNFEDRRLLLLGESCFSWIDEVTGELRHPQPGHPGLTISWAIQGIPRTDHPMCQMMTRGLCGEYAPSLETRRAAWATAAFTNYVPVTVGDKPRVRPKKAHWNQAADEWHELLAKTGPRNVVVIGKQLWDRLPEGDMKVADIANVALYRLENNSSVTCRWMHHPAAGGSWKTLMARISALEGA
jgi:hypothetical protein